MSEWQQLIQQGILGTSRQPTVPALPPTIAVQATPSKDDSGTTVAALDVETRFLQQAAILAHYEAVGLLPHALDEAHGLCETATAPPETNAAVSERAALLLQRLLADFDLKLVVEWVRHAARRRAYLPHEFLPTLLDYATKHQPLATALTPILGERGRWLIALNPAWQNSANEELHRDAGQQGSTNARVAYLEEQRRQAPTQARDALMAVWTQEAAAERAAFVGTLRINLSDGDRPFLEEAYTDRSINVRIIVTRLLAQLPNAALHRALLSELTNHLQIERKWLKRQLTMTLPKYFREQWHEWGIREQSPLGVRIGSKMGWLVQLIALVPPSTLVNALAVDAVDLLNLVRASEHAEPLLTALLEGAEQHQD
ncbi:MAG: hypothetical protein KDE31_35200, partial [Caldilineaceae bacterium]|nr:hypothetical protein [Caldilineaceae bacterium]